MSLGKKDIINNIFLKANISKKDSAEVLSFFIQLVRHKSKNSIVKIPNFGSFTVKSTPKRIGRNPKTKEEFIILKRSKLFFKSSNKIRGIIN
jgi:integration host factor subunit alpha